MSEDTQRKKKERINLARRIEAGGTEMIPCSHCEKENRRCLVDSSESKRCSECVRSKVSCDVSLPSPGDWESLDRQTERLEAEEEKASAQAQEAMARVSRLRKQKAFLRARGRELLRRGLRTLNELDDVEEKERKEKEEAESREQQARAASSSGVSGDHSADPLGYPGVAFGVDQALSPSFWESLDFVGGTAPGGPG
jgi:hypothetical protein